MGDHIELVPECPDLSQVQLYLEESNWTHSDHVSSLQAQGVIIPSEYMVCDYTHRNAPRIQDSFPMPTGTGKLTMFEYPANFNSLKGAEHRVKERSYAYESLQNIILGTSYVRSFTAGHRFTLSAPGRKEDQKEFVIYRLSIDADQNSYENTFEAIPADLPFHPLPVTPKPKIYGTQTAIVVGRDSEGTLKTDADRLGSVKVHFYWDHHTSPTDPNSSCFIRVASPYAGQDRGIVFTPHIGDEVVVSFENGDPDRPLVVGSVFGPHHSLPYVGDLFPVEISSKRVRKRIRINFDLRINQGKNNFLSTPKKILIKWF